MIIGDYIVERSQSDNYERYLEHLHEKEDEMYQDNIWERIQKESENNNG